MALAKDIAVSIDGNLNNGGSITTTAFSTAGANELLLAFVSINQGQASTTACTGSVTGAGLTWSLVVRINPANSSTGGGSSEIWSAVASSALTSQTVKCTVSGISSVTAGCSMTVVAFTGADTVNKTGATATASGTNGTPTKSLTTTAANSWVWGCGQDWTNNKTIGVGTGQSLQHSYAPTGPGDSDWCQYETSPTATSGTAVTLNTTGLGASDQWSLALVEVLADNSGGGAVTGTAAVASRKATVSSSGNYGPVGSAAVASRSATLSAAGWVQVSGTAAIASNKATVSASGTAALPGATGSAAVQSNKAQVSAQGNYGPTGTASVQSQKAQVAALGAVQVTGAVVVASRKAAVAAAGSFAGVGSSALLTLNLLGVGS